MLNAYSISETNLTFFFFFAFNNLTIVAYSECVYTVYHFILKVFPGNPSLHSIQDAFNQLWAFRQQ